MQTLALLPRKIFTGAEWLTGHAIVVKNGLVDAVLPVSELDEFIPVRHWEDAWIAPAFIDVQIYGAHRKLLAVYPEPDTLRLTFEYCRDGGATLYQPTVATNSLEVFHRCIDAVRAYWQRGGKGVHGLHLEGPWLNADKRGAHVKEFIHPPTLAEVKALLDYGRGVITMITLAPEVCPDEVVDYIRAQGIVVSAGHSNATFEEATRAFDRGIPTVTHLYNAMSALQHRAPGLVGAAMLHGSVRASIIADGHHVDFPAIRIAKQVMGERLFVITDAVTETTEGWYQHTLNGDKYESGGTLSGSSITMYGSMVNLVQQVGIPVEEALRMCSTYPAGVLGCSDKNGKIAPGAAAQFVVLNDRLDLVETLIL